MNRKWTIDRVFKQIMNWTTIVIALSSLNMSAVMAKHWGQSIREKIHIDYVQEFPDLAQRFVGNQTHVDFFKLLRQDGNSLLIGARNVIFNISLDKLNENIEQRITWNPSDVDVALCLLKGKKEVDCQNYIRVLAKTSDESLLVCGTNAFNPKCRIYKPNINHQWTYVEEFSGKGFCPYDPRHNSTAIFTGGELYSGTVADFSGTDSLIIRGQLRTEQYDYKHLNAPHFVSSLEDDKHVYFFFREPAVEYINCGKAIYSRVARVCKNDQGGPRQFKTKWTTFLKARLNCSVPGSFPFYFDEIQGTSQVIRDGKIYAVFNTPENSLGASAVCSFDLKSFRKSFEEGSFKNQENIHSNWLPMSKSQIPEPRPGICRNDSMSIPESDLNFIKHHSLMDMAVPTSEFGPIFIFTSFDERISVIVVDEDVTKVGGQGKVDVLFVGTNRGRILKLFNANQGAVNDTSKPILIESLSIFPDDIPVRNLLITSSESNDEPSKLVVIGDHEVAAVPLHRCSAQELQTCSACVDLMDPYCAWNTLDHTCISHKSFQGPSNESLLQSLENGIHSSCQQEDQLLRELAAQSTSSPEPTTTVTSSTPTMGATSTTRDINTEDEAWTGLNEMTDDVEMSLDDEATTTTPADPSGLNRSSSTACDCPCSSIVDGSEKDNGKSSKVPGETIQKEWPSFEANELTKNDLGHARDDNDRLEEEARNSGRSVNTITEPFFQPIETDPYEDAYGVQPKRANLAPVFSENTLAMSILVTALLCLTIGFSTGFWLSKRWEVSKRKKTKCTQDISHLYMQRPNMGEGSGDMHQAIAATRSPSSASTTSSTSSCSACSQCKKVLSHRLATPTQSLSSQETVISSNRSLNVTNGALNGRTINPLNVHLAHYASKFGALGQQQPPPPQLQHHRPKRDTLFGTTGISNEFGTMPGRPGYRRPHANGNLFTHGTSTFATRMASTPSVQMKEEDSGVETGSTESHLPHFATLQRVKKVYL